MSKRFMEVQIEASEIGKFKTVILAAHFIAIAHFSFCCDSGEFDGRLAGNLPPGCHCGDIGHVAAMIESIDMTSVKMADLVRSTVSWERPERASD